MPITHHIERVNSEPLARVPDRGSVASRGVERFRVDHHRRGSDRVYLGEPGAREGITGVPGSFVSPTRRGIAWPGYIYGCFARIALQRNYGQAALGGTLLSEGASSSPFTLVGDALPADRHEAFQHH